jgi:hypothetical protein
MERYLRLLDWHHDKNVFGMSFQICKFQLNDAKFLDYRPSQIAACAVILAINIHNEDLGLKNFHKRSDKGLELNTAIWNNEKVVTVTGFSISDLKQCLYDLADFIYKNLSPNRLQNFDIESIKHVEPYNELQIDKSNISLALAHHNLDLKNLR